jgi:hypothetical protein
VTSEHDSPDTSTLGSELLAGMLGAGVALACVLPPILHFVTGPLGPLIGGFVAASRSKPGPRGQAIIAFTVGSGLAGLVATAATVLVSLAGRSQLPSWFPSQATLSAILAGVWLYGVALAGVGTAISRAFARRPAE